MSGSGDPARTRAWQTIMATMVQAARDVQEKCTGTGASGSSAGGGACPVTNEHSTVIHNIHTGGSTIRCNLDIGEQDFKMNSCCVFGGLANHLLLALDGLDDKVVPISDRIDFLKTLSTTGMVGVTVTNFNTTATQRQIRKVLQKVFQMQCGGSGAVSVDDIQSIIFAAGGRITCCELQAATVTAASSITCSLGKLVAAQAKTTPSSLDSSATPWGTDSCTMGIDGGFWTLKTTAILALVLFGAVAFILWMSRRATRRREQALVGVGDFDALDVQ